MPKPEEYILADEVWLVVSSGWSKRTQRSLVQLLSAALTEMHALGVIAGLSDARSALRSLRDDTDRKEAIARNARGEKFQQQRFEDAKRDRKIIFARAKH